MTGQPEAYPDRDISELRDVLAEARAHRAPKDAAPRVIPPEGLPPIPAGPAEITHTEVWVDAETGVPVAVDQYTRTDWVAAPITREALKARGIHLR
ncbi:hypothetical protein MYCO108962_06610 [Mycobacterium colombiense]|uniref:Uncharacterized protein n=1 Tax=Mycobacterium colombiense CECT 3035 TaxID=1041522 RepID=J5E592_9MYCO|nr:hypothetical protein [Mycobacterium colombiense]EJO86754.1 hypothetical protein MCOL_V222633 [Mycobacterium colombiense CECT 3035]